MKTSLLYFIISFFVVCNLFQCNPISTKNNDVSIYLQSYLQKKNYSIPKNNHLFIFKSNLACKGCISSGIKIINNYIENINEFNTTIIDSEEIKWFYGKSYNLILDEEKSYERLNLDIYNFTLIWTNDNKIYKEFNLNSENIVEFDNFLKLYYH